MKTNIGLWIDQRKAVVVLGSGDHPKVLTILSHAERQPGRIEGERSLMAFEAQHVQADDVRQRKYTEDLNRYYDAILRLLGDARALLILGPGEAKGHLRRRLDHELSPSINIQIEAAAKMTDRQIVAAVRDHFKQATPVILSK
jgi:hypothetical protein